MATVITATEVVSQFGAYYIDNGQNETNIHSTLRETFEDEMDFTVVDTEDTILRESNTEFQEVIQSFQKQFTPKGGVSHTPREIKLYNIKIDEEFYPDELKNSWLQFMLSNKLDRKDWPYVKWFVEVYLMGQIKHDLATNLYGASYVAPTPGTAGTAAQSFNGLKKLINADITAGDITPIVTGAPNATPATWTTQVETFCKGIPELYWKREMTIQMSRSLGLRYKEGRAIKYNSNYAQAAGANNVQNFDFYSINDRGSLMGVSKIWATPKANAIMALKGGSNRNIVQMEARDRAVKVFTDFWLGVGFINPALLFTNDQDLV